VSGWKRLRMTVSRVSSLSALLLFISQAAVSVNDATAPTNCWYRLFSSTVTVWLAAGLLSAKEIGVVCFSRPRTTDRPPGSLVVVSQMLTGSAAASAERRGTATAAAAITAAASSRRPGRDRDGRVDGRGVLPGCE